MKVLSDIYTYSKDKSAVVFNNSSVNESNKQKKSMIEGSWFSKTWVSTPSMKPISWFNKISFPKYQMSNYSFPKCSFPKFTLPTVWFKSLLVKLEETRVNCYLYIVELFKMIKHKSCCICMNCSCLNCACFQFNSNPEYINYPWYKRVFFTIRDNLYGYININKESVSRTTDDTEEVEILDKKGSKAKVDEERSIKDNMVDDKYNMKHSQSSKYFNDLNTLRSSKKLKKTNTDDLKNGDNISTTNNTTNTNNNTNSNTINTIKNTTVFSMFSKSDIDSKSPKINSPVNKSGSLYVDANEDKYCDTKENQNIQEVTADESIPGSNETSEEKTKFNIKKTWDKFSKIIS